MDQTHMKATPTVNKYLDTLVGARGRAMSAVARRYSLKDEDLQAMHQAQGGRCYLCQEAKFGTDLRGAVVDHNHACCPGPGCCGRCVRGLACRFCNSLIGYFRDDPEFIRRVANGKAIPPIKGGPFGKLPANPQLRRIARNLATATARTRAELTQRQAQCRLDPCPDLALDDLGLCLSHLREAADAFARAYSARGARPTQLEAR
jgi:Recombination endonuclease VII